MKISLSPLPSNLLSKVRQQAESLREGNLGQTLPAAFDVLDQVAAHRPGSGTSRLAEIAKKVGRDGDSTVAELGGVELLEQMSSLGQAAAPALEILVGPVAAVVGATLDALEKAGPGDELLSTLAKTGLQAIESVKDSQNPMAGGLAGEAFLIGIAEHRELNETAGEVCDFLQEEMPATLVQPAREAYRSVLTDLSVEPSASKSSLLAGAGLAAFHAIPGQEKAFLPLITSFVEELGGVENPFPAAVAEEASGFVESYAKEKETEEKAVLLADAVLRTLDGKADPTSVQAATGLGREWVKTLSGLDLPAADRLEIAQGYLSKLDDELGAPAYEIGQAWLERLPQEDAATRFAAMDAILGVPAHALASPGSVIGMAQGVALDQPEIRNTALGALLGVLGEEMGEEELGELAAQPFSAEALAKKEQALAQLCERLSETSAESGDESAAREPALSFG